MKTTGYQLCDLLRKTADETANPERALIMTWAADEIEHLVGECKLLEKEKSRLADRIISLENAESIHGGKESENTHRLPIKTMPENTQIAPLDAPTCSSFFGDVPLKVAMIGWTPKGRFGKTPLTGIPGKIVIIPKTNDGRDWFRHLGVTDSTGACWSAWKTWTKEKRLLKLYIEAWHIIARDGVSPEDVHAAFMVIPEYRDSLSGETFFSWMNA